MSHRGLIERDGLKSVERAQQVRPFEDGDERPTNLLATSKSSIAQPNSGSSDAHCRVTQAKTKRILFFTGTTWAFGSVHSELVRYLHSRGVVGDVLDWSKGYNPQEMAMMAEHYDYIYGIPGETWPLTDNYGIPHNKIVVVAHGDYDLWHAIEKRPPDEFDRFAEYAVISDYLRQLSIDMGIRRIPKVVRYGINYQRFFAPISQSLKVVGYGGSLHRDDNGGVDWKRGFLAKEAAETAGLAFSPAAQFGQFHFLAMPRYYAQVDAVLVSSSREGYGLPAMEAAAAGRLVISTPVGGFPHQAALGAGISVPVDANEFKRFAIEKLEYYKHHPAEYVAMCERIQEAARGLDWDHVIDEWVAVFPSQ